MAAAALLAFETLFLLKGAYEGLWLIRPDGRTADVDFAEFWGAGKLAAMGHAGAAYRWANLASVLNGGDETAAVRGQFPFFYPPMLLLLLAPLAQGSVWSFAVAWVGGAAAAFLAFAAQLSGGRRVLALALALASPAGFLCISVGQNGLLTAALLGFGLALLDRRPILAGAVLGLLAYKPQFGVLLPVALAASGRWRSFAAAAVSVLAALGVSILAFGSSVWGAFFDALTKGASGTPAISTLPPGKLQSPYGLCEALGFSPVLGWTVQGAVCVAMVLFVALLWRSRTSLARKAAGLAAATLLFSPYSCIYDLTITVVAVLFLATDAEPMGQMPRIAIGAAYLLPLAFLVQAAPLGPLVAFLIMMVVAVEGLSRPQAAAASRP